MRQVHLLRWLCACLMVGSLQGPAPAQELEVVTSEVHALYYLLECLIDEPHRSPEMASTFRGRVSNWTPLDLDLRAWRKAREGPELSGLRLPRVQQRTPNLSTVLEKVSLTAANATDLADRTEPWLGPEHNALLRRVLTRLEPLFRNYYWSPAREPLAQRRQELIQALARGGFDQALTLAGRFYDGTLPTGQRPTLALIPHLRSPGISGPTRGHNSGTLQVLEVLTDRDAADQAGTVFHEFVHALWSGQSEKERTRWEQRFASHGAWGRVAYAQLNEGLATALGNGWFQRRVQGELASGSWYSDPVIDAYGHALLPVVESALEGGRTPSDEELDRMVEVFRQALPQALQTFDVVAADLLVISSLPDIQQGPFQSEIMRLGPVRWSRARHWNEPNTQETSTFRIYWLAPEERSLLEKVKWSPEERQGWQQFRLLERSWGWELAFEGTQAGLFQLLRHLQKEGLRSNANSR